MSFILIGNARWHHWPSSLCVAQPYEITETSPHLQGVTLVVRAALHLVHLAIAAFPKNFQHLHRQSQRMTERWIQGTIDGVNHVQYAENHCYHNGVIDVAIDKSCEWVVMSGAP